MTGLPEFNYPRFNKVAKRLRNAGYKVYNPAEITGDDGWSWEDYMKNALKMMLECDLVIVLESYESSRGANIEINLAKELGMCIITEKGIIINKGNVIK